MGCTASCARPQEASASSRQPERLRRNDKGEDAASPRPTEATISKTRGGASGRANAAELKSDKGEASDGAIEETPSSAHRANFADFARTFSEIPLDVIDQPSRKAEAERYKLSLCIHAAHNISVLNPASEMRKLMGGKDGYLVRLTVQDENGVRRYNRLRTEIKRSKSGQVHFDQDIELFDVQKTDMLRFSLYTAYFNDTSRKHLGHTIVPIKDLIGRSSRPELWLFTANSGPLFNRKRTDPTTISLSNISLEQINEPGDLSDDRSVVSAPPSLLSVSEPELAAEGPPKPPQESAQVNVPPQRVAHTESEPPGKFEAPGPDAGDGQARLHSLRKLTSTRILDADSTKLAVDAHNDESSDDEFEEANARDEGFGAIDSASTSSNISHTLQHLSADDSRELGTNLALPNLEELGDAGTSCHTPLKEAAPDTPIRDPGSKHLLVITRGTRGDVQPFIALARGLAEIKGWTVTICTELRYRELIRQYQQVSRGAIHFKPSGGDTESRINTPIAKWAVSTKLRLMHAAMLARAEREFFDSEPAFFYWAKRLQPDFLCYTFTTANITMIISEALNIPCVGFFLQPTVLPSRQYPPIVPLRLENLKSDTDQMEISGLESHKAFRYIKGWWEHGIFSSRIQDMRTLRGLDNKDVQENDFERILSANMPVIVPIKADAFGGKPNDWPTNVRMTDFIFLRGDSTPPLDKEMDRFINAAKDRGEQVMCICFSSMPINKARCLEASLQILNKCPKPFKPAIIALTGNHASEESSLTALEKEAAVFEKQGRLMIAKGAPFNKLFPRVDFIVSHGGLGSTAEAMSVGKPLLITGVLLLDQRFWGKRVFELGYGPAPFHISDFSSRILDVLPDVLSSNSKYATQSQQLAEKMFPGGIQNMSDGVEENVEAFVEACELARPAHEPQLCRIEHARKQSDCSHASASTITSGKSV